MAATKAESKSSPLDTVKLVAAILLLLLGIAVFYYFADQAVLYRVLGMLALTIAGAVVFLTSRQGHALKGFLKASRTEMRKVVWPTRAETLQTTLVVIVMVLLMGIFLWLLDMFLGWAVRFIISGGG
ncbi:MAG TPA: preprotein translocase subunit SecE [Chromatiales bacterium]|nr:preprotein translocase subunit SecE [Thiotrichales bacterium]HIP68972.1 preprotein translocase subunit SecE [Chromatiales bacterium]